MENKKIKVIVGLSGGVDSSVALIKLIEQGYDVEAMYMRNWDSAINNDVLGNPDLMDDVCPQERDYQDALAVANTLGIKLHRVMNIGIMFLLIFLMNIAKIVRLILIFYVTKKLNLKPF